MCLRNAPAPERDTLQARLNHAEKRAAVRSKNARQLPPKIQEAFFGTRYETLKNVYDEVGPEDIRDAMSDAGMTGLSGESGTNSEAQQRRISQGGD